ncbi:MAG: AbrB/MazE/SpoVT family DNA-binding domain-containing protein [Rhodospirillales bacterium]|nr:AbrB/MazE/SpoVT family DNA-binding domain-containing protein [Rhodospirillales bacterium]MDE0380469.1 AbrB/MazE/SpoVT family DNA-binding domain-containing protein [Rhodospirillales bacterium]
MGANLHIRKWGSSLAVRIPKAIAEQWGVSEGSAIEMASQGDRVVMRRRPYDLADMLSRVTAENLHPEQDTGEAQGSEQW